MRRWRGSLQVNLEVAILDVIPNQEEEFESAFAKASSIISSMSGYVSHQIAKVC